MIFASGHRGVSHKKYVGIFKGECVMVAPLDQRSIPQSQSRLLDIEVSVGLEQSFILLSVQNYSVNIKLNRISRHPTKSNCRCS